MTFTYPFGTAREQVEQYLATRNEGTTNDVYIAIEDHEYEGGYQFKGLFQSFELAKKHTDLIENTYYFW